MITGGPGRAAETVVAFMITMASALANMHRAEAKAVAIVCRTDTRTDKGAIPADGQMLQTIGRFLELDPGWYRGQMRADDPSCEVHGPLRPGGERRVHVLPLVGALVHVVLDVDADGVRELLRRPRTGRSRRRIVRSQERLGRLGRRIGLIGPVQAGFGRTVCRRSPDQRAEDRLGDQVVQAGQVHRCHGGQSRKNAVIGQVQQGPQRLTCGRRLSEAGGRRCAALHPDGSWHEGAARLGSLKAECSRGKATKQPCMIAVRAASF